MLTLFTFVMEDPMQRRFTQLTDVIATLWRTSPSLTATGLLMLPVLAAAGIGLWLDPRMITGVPAWLKPAKFAASIAIYTLTLAWVFTYLTAWVRTRRIVGRVTVITMLLEIVIIVLQAARGRTSHFNIGTPFDATLFMTMGSAIVVQTVASIAVAVALWRTTFTDRAFGLALRLGLTLTIAGAATGGLMTRPTQAQLAEARSARMVVAGAHTVGAPDGGPGLPGTGWSLEHGDLRVPHFIGLHALQAFAVLVLVLPRRWSGSRRVRMMIAVAASYTGLFMILLWQALRGESVAAPAHATLALLVAWAVFSAAVVRLAAAHRERAYSPAIV
jgi:hypothetical protein